MTIIYPSHKMYVAAILFLVSITQASSNCPNTEPSPGDLCTSDLLDVQCNIGEVYGGDEYCTATCASNQEWMFLCEYPFTCPDKEPEGLSNCPAELEGLECKESVWGGDPYCGKTCQSGEWSHWCEDQPVASCPDTEPKTESECPTELDGLECSEALWGGDQYCEKVCEFGKWAHICEGPALPTCPDTEPKTESECPAELDGLECSEALWGGDQYCEKVCEFGKWAHICEGPALPICPDLEPALMSECPAELEGNSCNDSLWGGDPTCTKSCENGQWFGICEDNPVLPTDEPTPDPTPKQFTDVPTDGPTDGPTDVPTDVPTDGPTDVPTDVPTSSGDAFRLKYHFFYSFSIATFLISFVPGI